MTERERTDDKRRTELWVMIQEIGAMVREFKEADFTPTCLEKLSDAAAACQQWFDDTLPEEE